MRHDKSIVLDIVRDYRRTLKVSVYRPSDWESADVVWYGDIDIDHEGDLIEVPFTTYSDYSGSVVERSNCRVWESMFEDSRDEVWKPLSGGYGTTGIIAKIELLTDDMLEVIENLFNYPLIDEDDFSELEYEIREESLDDYIIPDLQRETKASKKLINQVLFELEEDGVIEFVCEDASSAYMHGFDQAVERIKEVQADRRAQARRDKLNKSLQAGGQQELSTDQN